MPQFNSVLCWEAWRCTRALNKNIWIGGLARNETDPNHVYRNLPLHVALPMLQKLTCNLIILIHHLRPWHHRTSSRVWCWIAACTHHKSHRFGWWKRSRGSHLAFIQAFPVSFFLFVWTLCSAKVPQSHGLNFVLHLFFLDVSVSLDLQRPPAEQKEILRVQGLKTLEINCDNVIPCPEILWHWDYSGCRDHQASGRILNIATDLAHATSCYLKLRRSGGKPCRKTAGQWSRDSVCLVFSSLEIFRSDQLHRWIINPDITRPPRST